MSKYVVRNFNPPTPPVSFDPEQRRYFDDLTRSLNEHLRNVFDALGVSENSLSTHMGKADAHGMTEAANPAVGAIRTNEGKMKFVSADGTEEDVSELGVTYGTVSSAIDHVGQTGSEPHGATDASTPNSVMCRDAYSRTKVADPSAALDAVNKQTLDAAAPIGAILMWGKSSAPSNYLLCTGTEVSRTTYAALFAIIGTTFGAGNGSTTFNLPNFNAVVPKGVGSQAVNGRTKTAPALGAVLEDQMQAHSHTVPGTMSQGASYPYGSGGSLTEASGEASGRTGDTTRENCLGVYFIIRYK